MSKLNRKLLYGFSAIIIVILAILGIILGQIFKSFYLTNFDQRIARETNLIASIMESNTPLTSNISDQMLKKISKDLNIDVLLFDDKHNLIAKSSNADLTIASKSLNSYLDQLDQVKKAAKFSEKESGAKFYGKRITDQNGNKEFLIVDYSTKSIKEVYSSIWVLLFSLLGFVLFAIIILLIRYSHQFSKPIEDITQVAIELSKGNYKARTLTESNESTTVLSQAMNVLAKNLQEMTMQQEMQQDRLNTLIHNIGSGVVLINSRGHVNLINKTYRETFKVDSRSILGELYYDAFKHKEVIEIVEEIFLKEIKVRKQIILPLSIERKHFEIYGAPIIGINHEWKGIVLVFHDISELKKLEQVRKDFFANVSHELKTPITSIKGFTETLLDGAMESEELCKNFLSIILTESDRMQTLIQDLLDLSKIEQQNFKLDLAEVSVKQVIEDVHQMMNQKALEKNIEFKLYLNSPLVVNADALRLKQVFINLVDNAIHYTPTGGKVFVTAVEADDHIVIKVNDTGVGIGKEDISRIFERFYRVDKARSRNSGGTGLGLAIVKHLVEAHKGKVEVESKLGHGTSFIVTLNKNTSI
ncbi:PAS domain-containing sensor histidine kinase [Bacillus sp. AFS002410]|uniref:two-component system histidine kinase PnpS n=1 Tax=Bacillus sp. AFS002410 TaxID=2033481 RepID=UPI000BF0433B|nr:ATP-binding protein [Bacillus sp. AFS002410]PEJ57855.1 PAS domain-containing sensor histidine kinase [Bacillus sp. AFS002410]